MKRGTIFLILFVIAAAVIVGIGLFLQNQPPLEITIAVDPLAADWAREAATAFNDSNTRVSNGTRRVRVNISTVSDLDVWRSGGSAVAWSPTNHPAGWLAATTLSTDYANYPFEIVTPSTARTLLIWAGFSSRVQALTNNGATPFDWDRVVEAAEIGEWAALGGSAAWQFVRLAIPQPTNTIQGTAVLFSSAAAYNNTPVLDSNSVRGSYYDWMTPFVDRLQRFTGDVVAFMTRGPGTVAIGIAPESLWLTNLTGLERNEPMIFAYPEYTFVFDFPLSAWQDTETAPEQREAVVAFGNWLVQPAQQNSAMRYGLRPANANPTAADQPFSQGQQYGILLDPPLAQVIDPPSLNDTQGLLAWYERTRS